MSDYKKKDHWKSCPYKKKKKMNRKSTKENIQDVYQLWLLKRGFLRTER